MRRDEAGGCDAIAIEEHEIGAGAGSNRAIATCVHEGLRAAGLPETAVQVIATADRAAVGYLIADDKHVDVIVPRGGKSLIERVTREVLPALRSAFAGEI